MWCGAQEVTRMMFTHATSFLPLRWLAQWRLAWQTATGSSDQRQSVDTVLRKQHPFPNSDWQRPPSWCASPGSREALRGALVSCHRLEVSGPSMEAGVLVGARSLASNCTFKGRHVGRGPYFSGVAAEAFLEVGKGQSESGGASVPYQRQRGLTFFCPKDSAAG